MKNILVTGAAGFIGYHVSKRLCSKGYQVIGVDNLNNYYDTDLKKKRLQNLTDKKFKFYKLDINEPRIFEIFALIESIAKDSSGTFMPLSNRASRADFNLVKFEIWGVCTK